MPTLLEKIEASAAARLPLPAGRLPGQEVERYKKFLKVEAHRLKILHRAGAGGRELCRARAAILDVLLRSILDALTAAAPGGPKKLSPLTLVAIGGYGRGELNPQSDIDIMFLHDGGAVARDNPHPWLSLLTGGLLWDIGLKVGHAVRSVADCVQVANGDMQSKTSLIEARLIMGDAALFRQFEKAVLTKCVQGHEDEYIAARVQDQAARHKKHGNSATMQEPNIKNGCGGLRDYQNLHWMAFFKYRTRTTAELEKRELIGATEGRQLEAAYDFLLRVRNDLHYHLPERPVDVLSKNVQPAIAHNLGYAERSPSKRIEKFMGDLYTHSRHIYLITRNVEQRLALLPQPQRLPDLRRMLRNRLDQVKQQLVDGFKFLDGEIHAATRRVFRDQPRRLMRVFLHAQQRGFKLHPDLAQLIRQELSLVDRKFLYDEHVRDTFLEILNQRGNVAPILRAMHEVGLLGKYLPEFGKLTCLVQHEFYHQYTTDEHTLVCLERLDQIWSAEQPPFRHYVEMFHAIERPFVLYLALLLHDSGKALHTGKHAEVGGQIALRVGKRLHLDGVTTHSLQLIIEHHLTMVQISQRRDLDDPAVIRTFAAQMQNTQNLSMLTLHTLADSTGTSDKLWNDFKDSLLRTLHAKTRQVLDGGTSFQRAEARQRELLEEEVGRELPASFGEDELHAHFANLPPRYFQVHSVREIIADLALTHRFMHHQLAEQDQALAPVLAWHNEPDRGCTSLKICTWDRPALFCKIAGALSASGLNILSAQIFTRTDGAALDTFFVADARTGTLAGREERDRFESLLLKVLTSDDVDLGALIAKLKPARPVYASIAGERMPTRLVFDNDTAETSTVIDLETEDRLGLLHVISQALAEMDIDISLAKIQTEKGAAIDTFYVRDADGGKILTAERQKFVEHRLRTAIAGLDA